MSLSDDLRHELAAITPRSDCDRLAELSGLFHSAGSVHLRGRGEVSVQLDVADPAVARRAFRLLRAFRVGAEIRTYRRHAFERTLTEALRAVPRGEVVSYRELAALAGRPNAQRAAGSFCARNRFGLVVPCHRVVGADGIGSYGSLGVEFKRRLLGIEGVAL